MSRFGLIPDWASGPLPLSPVFHEQESKTLGANLKIYAYWWYTLPESGPYGHRRSLSTNRYVLASPADEVTLVCGDGRRYRPGPPSSCGEMLVLDGGGGAGLEVNRTPQPFAPTLGPTLTRTSEGFAEHFTDGGIARYTTHSADPTKFELDTVEFGRSLTRYHYGADGHLHRIELKNGRSVSFAYRQIAGALRLAAISDSEARVTRFGYDDDARLVEIVDPAGHETRYEVGDPGGLIRHTILDPSSNQCGRVDTWSAEDGQLRRFSRPKLVVDVGGAGTNNVDEMNPYRYVPYLRASEPLDAWQYQYAMPTGLVLYGPPMLSDKIYDGPEEPGPEAEPVSTPAYFDIACRMDDPRPFGRRFAEELTEFVRTKQESNDRALVWYGGEHRLGGATFGVTFEFKQFDLVRIVIPGNRFVDIEYERLVCGARRLKSMEDDEGRITSFGPEGALLGEVEA